MPVGWRYLVLDNQAVLLLTYERRPTDKQRRICTAPNGSGVGDNAPASRTGALN